MAPESSSSSYGYKPGGTLKFKGQDEKKPKKKKSKSSSSSSALKEQIAREALKEDERERERSGGSSEKRKLTDAEIRFEEVQRRRRQERIRKEASKTHKEKVSEFNRYLENLSEHHDIPKVGPG